MRKLLFIPLLCVCATAAAVVDRVAVVVGKTVFTETEVLQELRLTAFLNGQPLDLGAGPRHAAAERLVDQALIRTEMEIGHYAQPSPGEVEGLVRRFQQEHYPKPAEFQAALEKYGLTEDLLKEHLGWQLTVLRFTDVRFGAGIGGDTPSTSSADRQTASDGSGNSVDQQMDAWLKETRAQTHIVFKKEAFQ